MVGRGQNPASKRNLGQYKDMTDDEFAEAMGRLESALPGEYASRVQEKYEEFKKDYDMSDMKFNDTEILMNLCKDLTTKEDYEAISLSLRGNLEEGYSLTIIEKLGRLITDLNKNISLAQTDLDITRKTRQSSQEHSAREELVRLKKLASKFYKKKMQYIYCDECTMLLSTAWFNYIEADNAVRLTCGRCKHKTTVTSKELAFQKGTNHPEGFNF